MQRRKRTFISVLFLILVINSFSQIAVGQWRDHLPFSSAIQVVEGGNNIYCLTSGGIFYYDKSDNSVNKLTKVTGMSDVGMSCMQYSEKYGLLIVGYSNANIDIIKGRQVTNISDVKRKQISGSKTINSILLVDKYAYMSCGFGIVVLDIEKAEVKSTYFIGANGTQINVNEMAFDGTNLYAATDKGIYIADINNNNLENYQNWTVVKNIPNYDKKFNTIAFFKNRIITNYNNGAWDKDTLYALDNGNWVKFDTFPSNKSNTLRLISYNGNLFDIRTYFVVEYPQSGTNRNLFYSYFENNESNPFSAIRDKNGQVWIGDIFNGLIKYTGFYSQSIYPSSPETKNCAYICSEGEELVVVPGGRNMSWNRMGNQGAIYEFVNEKWVNYTSKNIPQFDTLYDFAVAKINPLNTKQIFIGSWGSGVIEFNNGQFINVYNNQNSTIQNAMSSGPYTRVDGISLDAEGNLWATNSLVENAVSARMTDGTWVPFTYENEMNTLNIGEMIVTRDNNKWVVLPNGGLFVFNTGSSISDKSDDQFRRIDIVDETGSLISNNVFSIAEDLNGAIWVGTDQGVVVYYNPGDIFTAPVFTAQRIKIPSDIPGQASYLLGNEVVTCIAIDGADRKWFGTDDAGVFLMSEDCTTQIENFNSDNSPLLSNNIMSLAVNNSTGEVFFGTGEGLVSYKGTATKGKENFNDIFVYPNPVRRNYTGLITVRGLVANSNVKITDITGHLVYEAIATGGQAVWDGKSLSGQKVHTGVYLVFCSNEDGSKSQVTKLLFLN